MNALAAAGARLLGGTIARVTPIQGGDLSELVRLTLADGREAIVKNGPAPQVEAEMLAAIAASGAPAPEVLAVSDAVLAIEFKRSGGSLAGAWSDLGAVLATLHAATALPNPLHIDTGARYGWHRNYAFGRLAIENGWTDDWPHFWAERRLMIHVPHVPRALGAGSRRCPRLYRTGCRQGRRPPCSMAIFGVAIFWLRTAG